MRSLDYGLRGLGGLVNVTASPHRVPASLKAAARRSRGGSVAWAPAADLPASLGVVRVADGKIAAGLEAMRDAARVLAVVQPPGELRRASRRYLVECHGLLPHRDVSLRRTDWVAIGGIADLPGASRTSGCDATDPEPTCAVQNFCSANRSFAPVFLVANSCFDGLG
jgi:hypothetical protein